MQLSATLLGFILAFSPIVQVVQGAPATSKAVADNATLQQNAQDAQTLNEQFKSLKATDACQGSSIHMPFVEPILLT